MRGFARHPGGLARIAEILVEQTKISLDGVTLLSPESAGYLLAEQIAGGRLPLAVAKRSGAKVAGIVLLAASQGGVISKYLREHKMSGGYLVEARGWQLAKPEVCPQCLANDARILPVAEFN